MSTLPSQPLEAPPIDSGDSSGDKLPEEIRQPQLKRLSSNSSRLSRPMASRHASGNSHTTPQTTPRSSGAPEDDCQQAQTSRQVIGLTCTGDEVLYLTNALFSSLPQNSSKNVTQSLEEFFQTLGEEKVRTFNSLRDG